MGQHQLLLLLLGVIVIGIGLAIGIVMFNDGAVSANRDALLTDLNTLALRAQQYYRKPRMAGGGGHSFTGLTENHLATQWANANGAYNLEYVGEEFVILKGIGTERDENGERIVVRLTVYADGAEALPGDFPVNDTAGGGGYMPPQTAERGT